MPPKQRYRKLVKYLCGRLTGDRRKTYMKIGLGNYYLDKYGLDEGAKRMAEHGYEFVDLSFTNTETKYYDAREEDFLEEMFGIKKTLLKHGIKVNQIHGPWRFPPNDGTEDDRAERFGKMTKAMVMAKHLGAKYMAVHPLMPFGIDVSDDPDAVYEINKRYYEALAKVGSGLGVTVCLENMPFKNFPLSRSEDILRLVKEINSSHLKVCFDVGHANLLDEPLGYTVRMLGDYLKIIHVHDNDGVVDDHLPPYDGNVDWADFAEGLFDIGFDGVFSLEVTPSGVSGEPSEDKEKGLAKIAKLIAG